MRQVFRWGVRHGLIRWSSARGARAGEVSAALMVDPAYAQDPFPHYETIRAEGPALRQRVRASTVSHAVATAVLRSPDFGVIGGVQRQRAPLAAVGAGGRRAGAARAGRAAVDAGRRPARPHPLPQARLPRVHRPGRRPRCAAAPRRSPTSCSPASRADATARLMTDYASLLPATVIAEMLGAPVAMSRQFLAWGAEAARSLDAGLSLPRVPPLRAGPAGAAAVDGRPLRAPARPPRRQHPLDAACTRRRRRAS